MGDLQNGLKVLDKGSLELLNVMGNDLMVVNAARVSFASESRDFTDSDAKLLRYLARNGHVSPFYHPTLQFRWKAPISVQRQAMKHKIGTAENSESTRYITVHNEFYVPETFGAATKDKKQGSSAAFCDQAWALRRHLDACSYSFRQYNAMIDAGVANEDARECLPLCTYTSWILTASLMAVLHFLKLRDHDHAQPAIREYAKAMRTLVQPHFPVSLAAFEATAPTT